MINLAEHKFCTGCGACAFKCPKGCITMREDSIGIVYPVVDGTNCVECHLCEKSCPVLNKVEGNKPSAAYAAWSNNEQERATSASGGVAAEMYKYAINQGYNVVGVSQNADFSVTHKMVKDINGLSQFKNSKYVFSEAYDAFIHIDKALKAGEKVFFAGLPCQAAALRQIYKNNENLVLADVVCHGTTPLSYLKQHISDLETKTGKKAAAMSFRDPNFFTYTYTFTLYDADGERFYAKRTKDGDTYQIGYHRGISYRENCYHCPFTEYRVADLTLADYSGLGAKIPYQLPKLKVSALLINTEKGKLFTEKFIAAGAVHTDERPVNEAVEGNGPLRVPTPKNEMRIEFEQRISECNGDFEKAIQPIASKYMRREKSIIRKFYRRIVGKIKRILK